MNGFPARSLTVPVLIATWEIECCIRPPVAGMSYEAPLSWRAAGQDLLPHPFAVTGAVERMQPPQPEEWRFVRPAEPGSVEQTLPALVRSGPLTVQVLLRPPLPLAVTLLGVLGTGYHGEVPPGVPATEGTVDSVDLVSWENVLIADEWTARPGTAELTPVDRAPGRYDDPPPATGVNRWRTVSAVLVGLRLPNLSAG